MLDYDKMIEEIHELADRTEQLANRLNEYLLARSKELRQAAAMVLEAKKVLSYDPKKVSEIKTTSGEASIREGQSGGSPRSVTETSDE